MTDSSVQNRLAQETSLYLRQHADNPVAWQPWDDEALALAQRTGQPILLSIGYSACHWCHVMAHESFEDEATARVMNDLYVNVKVDREERPGLGVAVGFNPQDPSRRDSQPRGPDVQDPFALARRDIDPLDRARHIGRTMTRKRTGFQRKLQFLSGPARLRRACP